MGMSAKQGQAVDNAYNVNSAAFHRAMDAAGREYSSEAYKRYANALATGQGVVEIEMERKADGSWAPKHQALICGD